MPNAAASISRAVEVAHRAGTLVVLTAGDAGLVQRKRPQLLEALRQGADLLFTNRCGTQGDFCSFNPENSEPGNVADVACTASNFQRHHD